MLNVNLYGQICLDPNLRGDKLCLRKSMVKFEGSKARNIEICTWASRLPMFLNRPLIKLLEDLGVGCLFPRSRILAEAP